MSLIDMATILPWALVACGCGLGYTLVRQSSRMVERLAATAAPGCGGATPRPLPNRSGA